MSERVETRLREFTEQLLTRSGGLVEWPDSEQAGIAILPPRAADQLHCGEMVRLCHQPGGEGLCLNLATDFLDRVVPLLEAEPRIGSFRLPDLYLKKGDLGDAVSRAFTWLNAKVVPRDARPSRVEYHVWFFLATIVSEDRWEDVLPVTVNARSKGVVGLPDPLAGLELEPVEPRAEAPSTYKPAALEASRLLEARSAAFVGRLESRLERDRKRVRDYYNALLREEDRRKHRQAAPDDKEKYAAKRRAVELELQRKISELDEQYAIRAELNPVILVRLEMQVLDIQCEVFRKQVRKMHSIYWNPLLKELEPLACSNCGVSAFSMAFTNSDVKPLCSSCAAASRDA